MSTLPTRTSKTRAPLAWLQFFKHQPSRDREWKGWLFRVAQREAYRVDTLERREAENIDRDGRVIEVPDPHDGQAERDEFIAAIQELRRLPPRLQRLVLLRSQVETQQDLAKHEGLTPGRVSFLLAKVARLVDQRARRHERELTTPRRAARLRELEDDPPVWLTDAIGPRPGRARSSSSMVIAWRRTALMIDDYRRRVGYRSPTDAIGATPIDRDARRAHQRVERAVTEDSANPARSSAVTGLVAHRVPNR